MNYQFSVGNLVLKQGIVVIKTIDLAKNISIDYRINTHKEYGPEGQVISEDIETEDLTLSCDFMEASFDTGLDVGAYYDIVLDLGGEGGNTGISLTLYNCRITGYNMKSSQAEFVISTLSFSKRGKITDGSGAPTVQTVKFGPGNGSDIYIGDHASVDVSYDGNVIDYIIPTALGIGLMSTNYVGGGKLNIAVKGYVKKASKIEVEQYLINLYTSLRTLSGTLTVAYGLTSYTLTNVCFMRGSASGGGTIYANFTLDFIKSAY